MKIQIWLVSTWLLGLASLLPLAAQDHQEASVALGPRHPLVAVWCRDQGMSFKFNELGLRIAIWEDGRVLFAADPKKWGQKLQQGFLSPERVTELKKRLAETGVFALKGTAYLVPDASTDCILVDLGTKQQLLYWDEVESKSYGINSDPTPDHLKFKDCWKALNRLALASRPKDAKAVQERLEQMPRSWYLKPAIESK
jgi:hypothetical protein